jgi:hypothetical protein
VEHKGVGVGAQIRDDERDLVLHQARNEMNVAAEPIQFGDDYCSPLSGPCVAKSPGDHIPLGGFV